MQYEVAFGPAAVALSFPALRDRETVAKTLWKELANHWPKARRGRLPRYSPLRWNIATLTCPVDWLRQAIRTLDLFLRSRHFSRLSPFVTPTPLRACTLPIDAFAHRAVSDPALCP